jgi:creatinine deaminase
MSYREIDQLGLQAALAAARKGYQEGGIPIGAALVQRDPDNDSKIIVLGSGHNERIQKSSATLHGEMAALEAAGRLKPGTYRTSTMVSRFENEDIDRTLMT